VATEKETVIQFWIIFRKFITADYSFTLQFLVDGPGVGTTDGKFIVDRAGKNRFPSRDLRELRFEVLSFMDI